MKNLDRNHQQILGVLASKGIASSLDLQSATGKSQPTISRLLADLSSQVVTLGRARAARYGLPKSIHGMPAQQPIHWTSADGSIQRIGTLSLLAGDVLHVESEHVESTTTGALPWFLSPLQAQGFLGRLLAQRLSLQGVDAKPEAWNLETALFAALHLRDAPGAISIGDVSVGDRSTSRAISPGALATELDVLAMDVARTLPAGSSAGGEQPKFIAQLESAPSPGCAWPPEGVQENLGTARRFLMSGQHVIVKFTPPRDTPFGDRWRDLLYAEALASSVLSDHGVPVARATVIESATRAYLLSERFDRIGGRGRRHVVSVGAAHKAFVAHSYANWGLTCEALARGRHLPREDAARAAALLQFGRLIGNSDMHSGNLGLFVELQDLAKARFALAPVYDMLPMRWRPDAALGGAPDYSPFEPDALSASGSARGPAHAFWERLAQHDKVGRDLRRVSGEMAQRV